MGRQAGYTIVEVILFLALTGLLIMVTLNGFNRAINNNRKTDTTRSFESSIESIYSGVRTGEATRPVDGSTGKAICIAQEAFPGASNECLVIGKLLRFQSPTQVDVYNIVANVNPDPACAATGVQVMQCYAPRVLDVDRIVDHINPQWQANIADRKSTRLNSSHTDISRMPSSA